MMWFLHFIIKCLVTGVAAFTLHNVMASEGYTIDLSTLIVACVLMVVMIKAWTFNYKSNDV